jgi:hypothetical protein
MQSMARKVLRFSVHWMDPVLGAHLDILDLEGFDMQVVHSHQSQSIFQLKACKQSASHLAAMLHQRLSALGKCNT